MSSFEHFEIEDFLKQAKSLEKQDLAAALTMYQKIILRDSRHPIALNAGGRLAYQLGQHEQALQYWSQLVQFQPNPKTWANIGSLQSHLNQLSEAERSLTNALSLEPALEQAHYQMVLLLFKEQKFESALKHLQSAWDKYGVKLAESVLQASLMLMQKKNYVLADLYFALCCQLNVRLSKRRDQILSLRANCALFVNDSLKAQHLFLLANQFAVHPLAYTWPKICALPYVYQSREHLLETRHQFEQQLQNFQAELALAVKNKENLLPVLESACPAFLLSYQGLANVELMSKIGNLFTTLLKSQGLFVQCSHVAGQNQKIRVGFVSSFFYHHSVTLCYGERIIHMAQQDDFEVVCLYLQNRHDSKTQWLKDNVHEFINIVSPIKFQDILDLQLDILIYTDIGMEAKTYQLGLHRLAPIQILISGHPETSGLPEIDYYLSHASSEDSHAQQFYTEKLIKLKKGFSINKVIQAPEPLVSLVEIGFEPEAHIYFCPMTLFKVHPDFDRALAEILVQDPQGLIYFVQDSQPALAQALQARFQKTLPLHAERIRFLPWMDQQTFYSALLQADVVLDTFHFGGGTTSKISLALGVPIVCYPGEQNRARMTAGYYTVLGLEAYVPQNQQEYIQLALKLASDKTYRVSLSQKIKKAYPLFIQHQYNEDRELYHILRFMIQSWPQKINQIEFDTKF